MSEVKFSNTAVSSALQTPIKHTPEKKLALQYKPSYSRKYSRNPFSNSNNICNAYSINSIFNSITFKKNTPKFIKLDPNILKKHEIEKIYSYKIKYTSSKPRLKEYRVSLPRILRKTNEFLDVSSSNNSKQNKSKNDENKSFFEEATKKIHDLKKKINKGKNNIYKNDYYSFIIHTTKNVEEDDDDDKVQQVMNYKESRNKNVELSENDIYRLRKTFERYKNRVITNTDRNIKRKDKAVVLPNLYLNSDKKKYKRINISPITNREEEKGKEKIKIEINE